MANTYGTAVDFKKELNVWTLFAKVTFGTSLGSNGANVILDTNNSLGICAAKYDTVVFTGGTLNSVTTIGTVSSFAGLFSGMTVAGPSGELQSNSTIGSWSAAGDTITLSKQAIVSNDTGTYFATGGRYRFQFGSQEALRVNPYVKLLGMNISWDMSTGSAAGQAAVAQVGVAQSAPNAMAAFVIDNKISTKTIPATASTASTDASIAIQFGYGQGPGTGFVAANPVPGSVARITFFLGNSYRTS